MTTRGHNKQHAVPASLRGLMGSFQEFETHH
jgi:hypothetical protein